MIAVILISKLIYFALRKLGKGATTLPGKVALAMKYNVLNPLSENVTIICVTGTNGKTTTCALIEQGIIEAGKSYFINKGGANMLSGVVTAFIVNSTLTGRCKKDYAILECDENSLPVISRYLDADIVLVTNLFRDQLDRYGEVDMTYNKIKSSIANMSDPILVLNGDCPLTYSLKRNFNGKAFTFGVNISLNSVSVSDNRFCPICNGILNYKTRSFAQLGDFYCVNCGYKHIVPDYFVSDVIDTDDNGSTFVLNGKLTVTALGGLYNIYNYVSAKSVLDVLEIDNHNMIDNFSGVFGRLEQFRFKNHTLTLMLVKNPVGLSNCVKYAAGSKSDFDIAFALNDNEADGRDVSWIWDGDFTPLTYGNRKTYTIGKRAYDMAVRLKYSDISVEKIINGEDYNLLVNLIKSSDRDFVVLSTYTSMMNMRHIFIREFGGKEFWQ